MSIGAAQARIAEIRRAERAEADAKPVTIRCVFCKWHFHGTLLDGRRAHEIHRQIKHPEVQPPRRRTSRNLTSNRQAQMREWEREEIDAERRRRARLLGVEIE